MKWIAVAALPLILGLAILGCNQQAQEQQPVLTELTDDNQRHFYALGYDLANSLKKTGQEIDQIALFQGMKDAFGDQTGLLTDAEVRKSVQEFQQMVQASRAEQQQTQVVENLKKAEEFLAENKNHEGVVTTESGLQYLVLVEGDGPQPVATDRVKVHYHGTLIDGTVFDSSVERGEPTSFGLNRVIPGWTEGVQLMKVGSKYRFFVPPDLAYGERSPSPQIEANSLLIFEVELLDIEK
jgi:FKBP-type peptidyl-prolyl cis-trans isomerase